MSKCQRNMSCRCSDCLAALDMFSAKDLVAVASSKVVFEEGEKSIDTLEEMKNESDKTTVVPEKK